MFYLYTNVFIRVSDIDMMPINTFFRQIIFSGVCFFSLLISQSVLANNTTQITYESSKQLTAKIVFHDAYIYDLQAVDPEILADDVKHFKNQLLLRQIQLKNLLQSKQFNRSDTVISLVMPGGFLYASYRMYEQENATKLLNITTADINDFYDDLDVLSKNIAGKSFTLLSPDKNKI